jgi:carbon monoxide dehydrogenase subunit G
VRLSLTRALSAPPAVVWPHLCEPQLMNRWSLARVELLVPAEGGAGAAGTTRRIHVRAPLRDVAFDEVITRSEPPARLAYRVTGLRLLRRHHGEITLEPAGAGTRLRWDVDLAFAIPGMAALARRIVSPQLARSLDRLAAVLAG